MTESKPGREPIVAVYRGPSGPKESRGVNKIEEVLKRWNLTFDQLILEVLNHERGAEPLTILDFGSGKGVFGLDTFENPHILSGTKKALEERLIGLKYVGLKDSPTPKRQGTEDPLFSEQISATGIPEGIRENSSAKNFFFTITARQDLESFCEQQKIAQGKLDLFIASQSMLYLSGRVFAATMDSALARLRIGGKAFIFGTGTEDGPLSAFTAESSIDQASASDLRLPPLPPRGTLSEEKRQKRMETRSAVAMLNAMGANKSDEGLLYEKNIRDTRGSWDKDVKNFKRLLIRLRNRNIIGVPEGKPRKRRLDDSVGLLLVGSFDKNLTSEENDEVIEISHHAKSALEEIKFNLRLRMLYTIDAFFQKLYRDPHFEVQILQYTPTPIGEIPINFVITKLS